MKDRHTPSSPWIKLGVPAGLCALIAASFLFFTGAEKEPVEPFTLQGDLIDPAEGAASLVSTNVGTRKGRQRYKPGSLPQRLVQSQYRMMQSGQTNLVDLTLAPTNLPPEVMLLANQSALATSLVPDEHGYRNIGFDFLAGFDFDLAPGLVTAGQNQALASEKILAQIPEAVRNLDQRKVRLRGFLLPVFMTEGRATEFLLMRDQTLCCYGTVPRVNEWIHVRAAGKGVEPIMDIPITVTGTLRIGDQWENGYFTGIYLLHADSNQFVK